jgi:hypothetical protein
MDWHRLWRGDGVMARVRLFGQEFTADLVKQVAPTATGEAQWQAIARAHTGRTVPGTSIIVKQSEIIEAAAAEMPDQTGKPQLSASSSAPAAASATPSNEGLNELEAGMAKERKTLPSPGAIIAEMQAKAKERRAEQEAVSVPSGPTQRPSGRPHQQQVNR